MKTAGYNKDGKTVITFKRTVMVYKKDHSPAMSRPKLENAEGERA